MKKISKGSRGITVTNSGQVGFLYDASQEQRIAQSGAGLLEGYGGDSPLDERWNRLARDRLLVAFELPQDDGLVVEVIVGDDLTPEETGSAPWLDKPERALLSLPSGRLRIETYDTLRAREEPPDERGGSRLLEPGVYKVTFYRPDILRIDCPDDCHHVIVLTPLGATHEPIESTAWFPCRRQGVPAPIERPPVMVKNGKWSGKVLEPGRSTCIDFDVPAASELGLTFGQVILVKIGKRSFEALFVENLGPDQYGRIYGRSLLQERPGLKLAWWAHEDDPQGPWLVLGEDRDWNFRRGT